MARFKFDEEDLEANRGGNLSSKQAQAIRNMDRGNNWFLLVFGLGCLGGSIWTIVRLIPRIQQGFDPAEHVGPIGLVIVLLFLGLILLRGVFTSLSTEVSKVEGKLTLLRTERRNTNDNNITTGYHFSVGGREWGILPADFDLFEEGERYAVYFSPDTTNLLSLERIEAF